MGDEVQKLIERVEEYWDLQDCHCEEGFNCPTCVLMEDILDELERRRESDEQ